MASIRKDLRGYICDDREKNWSKEYVTREISLHKKDLTLDHPDGCVTTSKLADGSVTEEKIEGKVLSSISENKSEIERLNSSLLSEISARKSADERIEEISEKTEIVVDAVNSISEDIKNGVLKGEKGDKGDTGEKGEKGDKGDKGDTGETGPKGDKGDTGETGPKGDKGGIGETGPKGDKGEDGYTPIKGVDYYTDEDKTELEEGLKSYINDNSVGKKTPQGGEIFNSYEGNYDEINYADGEKSHAEGNGTHALGIESHSEGLRTGAIGRYSHSEGGGTGANGMGAHAEGGGASASGDFSHAEGYLTVTNGMGAHAEGVGTIASWEGTHVQGKYNVEDTSNQYAHIIGGGTEEKPKNIHTVDWYGNAWFDGSIQCTSIIMKSPNGGIFMVGIDDDGNFTVN